MLNIRDIISVNLASTETVGRQSQLKIYLSRISNILRKRQHIFQSSCYVLKVICFDNHSTNKAITYLTCFYEKIKKSIIAMEDITVVGICL